MKICKVEGCNEKYYAKGYCRLHYKMPSQLNPKPIKKSPTKIGDYTMTKRTPIAKISDKQKKINIAYTALRKAYMFINSKCMFKDCNKPSEECHHIRGRGKKYMLDTTEWMAVCSFHHRYIHENDAECRELGYLKSRLEK